MAQMRLPIRGADPYERIAQEQLCILRDVTPRERAQALSEAAQAVTRVLAETNTLLEAAPNVLEAIGSALGWDTGDVWMMEADAGGEKG